MDATESSVDVLNVATTWPRFVLDCSNRTESLCRIIALYWARLAATWSHRLCLRLHWIIPKHLSLQRKAIYFIHYTASDWNVPVLANEGLLNEWCSPLGARARSLAMVRYLIDAATPAPIVPRLARQGQPCSNPGLLSSASPVTLSMASSVSKENNAMLAFSSSRLINCTLHC